MDPLLARAEAVLGARFAPQRVLGRGGSGFVVAALDRSRNERVAVKIFDDASRDRLAAEARAGAALRHPAAIRVYDADEKAGFIVMELIDGVSLADYLARNGPLPLEVLRALAASVLGVLAEAHAVGIIHRDVKPSNILLPAGGGAKLGDFGVARHLDRASTGSAIGTPAYAAPEQLRGVADARSDVYAAGATLFEAATGEQLHAPDKWIEDRAAAVLRATQDAPLAAAIARALEERPERRFADAAAFLATIAPAAPRRALSKLWLIAVLAVICAALVIVRVRTNSNVEPPAESALARGVRELDAGHLLPAQSALVQALEEEPNSAQVHYALALLRWWSNRDAREIGLHIDRALELGVAGPDRLFLEGLRLLESDHPDAAARHFRAALADHPAHRDLRYGLFEALFHSGRAPEAIAEYRALLETNPGFRLGAYHLLTWATLRGDEALFRWVFAQLDLDRDPEQAAWHVRWEYAERRYDHAAELLRGLIEARPGDGALLQLSIAIEATRGNSSAAEAIVSRGTQRPIEDRLAEYGLAIAGKKEPAPARDKLLAALRSTKSGGDHLEPWLRIILIEAAEGRSEVFRALVAELLPHAADPRIPLVKNLGLALLRLPPEELPAFEQREYSEAAAALSAQSAEEAAASFARAIDASSDGRFLLSYQFLRARALKALHRDEEAAAACETLKFPRIFRWEWAALASRCGE